MIQLKKFFFSQITIVHQLGLAEKNYVFEKRKGKIYNGTHQNELKFEHIPIWVKLL
jgi:hypothetical protein